MIIVYVFRAASGILGPHTARCRLNPDMEWLGIVRTHVYAFVITLLRLLISMKQNQRWRVSSSWCGVVYPLAVALSVGGVKPDIPKLALVAISVR